MNTGAPNNTWKEKLWILYRFLARLRMVLSGDRIHETPEGERYYVNQYSYVERCIAEGGFEKTRATYLRAQLSPQDVFVDIGANIGLFTIMAGRRGTAVVVFEPDPFNCERLRRNIKLNGLNESRTIVHRTALGDTTGQIKLHRPLNDNYGMASVVSKYAPDGIQVPLRRLDDMLTLSDRRYVVKVDVEGAELQVLDGARATLEKMKPGSLWMVEVHVSDGVDLNAVTERFQKAGYDLSYFDDATGKIETQPPAGDSDVVLLAQRKSDS
jgi:FkbM family methyltransferase